MITCYSKVEKIIVTFSNEDEYNDFNKKIPDIYKKFKIVSKGVAKFRHPGTSPVDIPVEWVVIFERDIEGENVLLNALQWATNRIYHDSLGDTDPAYSKKLYKKLEKILNNHPPIR